MCQLYHTFTEKSTQTFLTKIVFVRQKKARTAPHLFARYFFACCASLYTPQAALAFAALGPEQ